MNIPPNPDPARLLAAFRTGDREAWDTLYRDCAPRLLAWAQSLTGCRTDAEDLVQETYIAAYLGAESFNRKSRLLTWLFGIALRRYRDKSRTHRLPTLPLRDEILTARRDSFPDPDALLPLAYREAVAGLPDGMRETFVLVVQHGFTHREAAQILRTPEGTIKWRVVQATRRLRVALADFEPSPVLVKETSQ